MTHFTDAELIRWSEHGPGTDRDRVVAHVAECAACAARYAAAVRTRPLESAEADLVPPSQRRTAQVGIVLAIAATIALAVFVARRAPVQPPIDAPVFRGGSLHAIAPDGATTADTRFEWASGTVAARYTITVGGSSGPIYTFVAPRSPAPFPDDLRSRLVSGTDYWWTVSALDAEGRTFMVSERRPFRIRTP